MSQKPQASTLEPSLRSHRNIPTSLTDRMLMEVPGLAQVAEHRTGSKGGNWIHPDHTEAFLKGKMVELP